MVAQLWRRVWSPIDHRRQAMAEVERGELTAGETQPGPASPVERSGNGPGWNWHTWFLILSFLLLGLLSACVGSYLILPRTPSPTYTWTPSRTPTPSSTWTSTLTRTSTGTPTRTFTPTSTSTPSLTPTPTSTGSLTFTSTRTPTPSQTPTRTYTGSPTRTSTPTYTPTPSRTPTRSSTPTFTPTFTSTPAAWYNCSWSSRKKITIDHTKVSADLGNFPVLINLASDTDLAARARLDGFDLLFTSANGTTQLRHEIESYTSASGALVAWVKVPALSSTVDTVLYLYYGNPAAADQQNVAGVWDANYMGVWHLPDGTTLSANDSTSNNNDGTITGATATSAEMDGGGSFSGTNQYIDVGNKASLQITGDLTIEAWVNPTNFSDWREIFGKTNVNVPAPYDYYLFTGSGKPNLLRGNGGTFGSFTANNAPPLGSWSFIAVTMSGTSVTHYLNGGTNGSGTISTTIGDGGRNAIIGSRDDQTSNFSGRMDEVRISQSARSAGWIATEYNNQNSPAAFYALSTEETSSGYCATATPTPSNTPTFTPTNTSTATSTPSSTPTDTPVTTSTPSSTSTPTRTSTWTLTSSQTPTRTSSSTPTSSRTLTRTSTWTQTPSQTPTRTSSSTPTPSRTLTRTSTPTPTRTYTPTRTPTGTPLGSFGKISPVNGSTGNPTSLTLSWGSSQGAKSYNVCYDAINNNACDTYWTNLFRTSLTISGLDRRMIYYWQVVAVNPPEMMPADAGQWWSFAPDGRTQTASPSPTPTWTPSRTPTSSSTWTLTRTLSPTATWTPSQTLSRTPTSTSTPTSTPTDTPTDTFTPSHTPTDTPTNTFTPSSTPTDTPTATSTPSNTPTPTPTSSPTDTPIDTPTDTPTATSTPSPTSTYTPTATSSHTPAWYNSSWLYRKKLTIDHTKVSGTANLSSFPVLVSYTDASLKTIANGGHVANASGYDIIFTASDGVTKLDHEIETYTAASGAIVMWVRIPSLSYTVDTDIYVYYGNGSIGTSQENKTGVWDTNFAGVWHLKENTGVTAVDSTSNANNAVPNSGNPTASTGQIGGALTFFSTSRLVIAADTALDLTSAITPNWTMSAWVKPTSYTGTNWPTIYSYGSYRASMGLSQVEEGTNGRIENWTNDTTGLWSTSAVTLNTWNYVTITRTAATTTFYLNGSANGSCTTPGAVTTGNQVSGIGSDGNGAIDETEQFLGLIDEVQLSNTARSAGWVGTEYNNQANQGTGAGKFIKTLGSEESY